MMVAMLDKVMLFLILHQIADGARNKSEGRILNLSDIVKVTDDLRVKIGGR